MILNSSTSKAIPFLSGKRLDILIILLVIKPFFSYCVDSLNALRLDSRLAKVQGRFVPDESLNLTSYMLRVPSIDNTYNASSPAKKRKLRVPVKRKPTEYNKTRACETTSGGPGQAATLQCQPMPREHVAKLKRPLDHSASIGNPVKASAVKASVSGRTHTKPLHTGCCYVGLYDCLLLDVYQYVDVAVTVW